MVANTVSVTEERKTEEIHETPQSAKGDVSLAAASEDDQLRAVGDDAGGLQTVEVAAVSGNESAPTPVPVVDEGTAPSASPSSPETPPVSPPESADSGKKDKQKVGSRFSLFGKKKKKKSRSESEDLKNAQELDAGDVDNRQKRGSKSPKSADAFDGDGGKRSSGGPFSFLSLKRSKSKASSKVPVSESAPTLDVDESQGDVGERIVYELEDEGNVVAKIRPKSTSSDDKVRRSGTGTAVAAVDEAEPTVERPAEAGHHLVVVAIDFGTTFSGYAFSFVRDRENTPPPADGESFARDAPIHMMRRWEGGDPGVINQKTLTALLLTPVGQFQAFGFTARNFYHDLDPTEAQRWMYFDKFKMALHSDPVKQCYILRNITTCHCYIYTVLYSGVKTMNTATHTHTHIHVFGPGRRVPKSHTSCSCSCYTIRSLKIPDCVDICSRC